MNKLKFVRGVHGLGRGCAVAIPIAVEDLRIGLYCFSSLIHLSCSLCYFRLGCLCLCEPPLRVISASNSSKDASYAFIVRSWPCFFVYFDCSALYFFFFFFDRFVVLLRLIDGMMANEGHPGRLLS